MATILNKTEGCGAAAAHVQKKTAFDVIELV